MQLRKLALAEDELHEAAIRDTGLDDFGEQDYLEGMRRVLAAYDADLQLTDAGWRIAFDTLRQLLRARLYAQQGWKEHPQVLSIPIHRPIVITGLPRTGTTALHRLLAMDPQFQALELWLLHAPMMRPPRETWETHPAYRACVGDAEARCTRMPDFRKAHDLVADEVEDCTRVLMQSFVKRAWEGSRLPTYERWFLSQSVRSSYRHYANVLRLIGGREPHRRWLLKSPSHLSEIDTLIEEFPDVCIVQTHRDPIDAIPSFCNLQYMVARSLEGEAARPEVIGPRQCARWRHALDRMQAARRKSPLQFLDVDHRRLLNDPLGVVHSIYGYFGLPLSIQTEQRMRAWAAASPTSRHGRHQYAVDSWGVRPDQIRDAFAAYRTQYQFN